MPWFIDETVGMTPGIAEAKTKPGRMPTQPLKGLRLFKGFREGWTSRRANVHGAPRMVFAVSWSGIHPQDFVERNSPSPFSSMMAR